MPTYYKVHKETGEKQSFFASFSEHDEWKESNPDWETDWSKGCASTVGQVGDFQMKTDGGWDEVLHKVSKVPGSNVRPHK